MASELLQPLTGFRDFYPEDFARRRYLYDTWRASAEAFGFVEYDGPVLEKMELYRKKSGGELVGQLFDFEDKGGRHVALRPEMTPTLARMVAARERHYKKPVKWFSIAPFFRFERPQKGRLREFNQFNADIFGEAGVGAEIELIALSIEIVRRLGFGPDAVRVRLSSRALWSRFLAASEKSDELLPELLSVIDKLDFDQLSSIPEKTFERLNALGVTADELAAFASAPDLEGTDLQQVVDGLIAAGLGDYLEIDAKIVRGLAYYTGTVFELFDASASMRAIAGGGRYDTLVGLLSDGAVELPALGMAFGDVVLGNLIDETPAASALRDAALRPVCDVFVVVADEARRNEALALTTALRRAGLRINLPLAPAKVGKQFQAAEEQRAPLALVVGTEWPIVKIKTLASRAEQTADASDLLALAETLAKFIP